jgi:hypothetical protein
MRAVGHNRDMRWPVVGGMVVSLVLHGCLACNELGCTGGFAWEARPRGSTPLEAGTYEVEILLDDTHFSTTCTVADTFGASDCTILDEGDWHVAFELSQLDPNEWMPEDPAGGFRLRASQFVEDGRRTSTRGPRHVEIEITLDGAPLVFTTYDVEYERDEDFYGDERCGFCDLEEERRSTF